MKKSMISLILVMLLVLGINLPLVNASPNTINQDSWLTEEISKLLAANNIIRTTETRENTESDSNNFINRGELAIDLAKALDLEALTSTVIEDIKNEEDWGYMAALVEAGIINTLEENQFKPEAKVSRAQLATILTKALGLDQRESEIKLSEVQYQDLSLEDSANNSINLVSQLGLFNKDSNDNFRPNENVNRVELAEIMDSFHNLEVVSGTLIEKYPLAQKIRVLTDTGQNLILDLDSQALIGRNNQLVELDSLLNSDQIYLVLNRQKRVKYLKAYGMITESDLVAELSKLSGGLLNSDTIDELSSGNFEAIIPELRNELKRELSAMTKGALSPQEVESLSQRDFGVLESKLKSSVEEELLNQGLSQMEIQAILSTDWEILYTTGRLRLLEAVSIQTGLPMSSINALLSQDWKGLQDLAELELMQRLSTELLTSNLLS